MARPIKRAVIKRIAERKRVSLAVARHIYDCKSIAEKQRLCQEEERRMKSVKSGGKAMPWRIVNLEPDWKHDQRETSRAESAEPVAWRWPISHKHWSVSEIHPGSDVTGVEPLYAAPVPFPSMHEALRQFIQDLRHNPSGGDDYPWEIMRGVADFLDEIITTSREASLTK